MPRPLRNYLPGIPAHVTQRGVDRAPCFFNNADRAHYLRGLDAACKKYDVSLHAYVLMTNHVHLLMTPGDERGISRVMQSLGTHYVQYVNRRKGRTGTLWEDRHDATLIDTDRYLLSCYRYVEMNPVRARMIERPEDYLWSSYRSNALGEVDPLVTPHETYLALGASVEERTRNYRALFEVELPTHEITALRLATQWSIPLGSDTFRRRIKAEIDRLSSNNRSRAAHAASSRRRRASK